MLLSKIISPILFLVTTNLTKIIYTHQNLKYLKTQKNPVKFIITKTMCQCFCVQINNEFNLYSDPINLSLNPTIVSRNLKGTYVYNIIQEFFFTFWKKKTWKRKKVKRQTCEEELENKEFCKLH